MALADTGNDDATDDEQIDDGVDNPPIGTTAGAETNTYDGYNPFTGQFSSSSSSSSSDSVTNDKSMNDRRSISNIISLRKTTMQDLTRQLLDAVDESSYDTTTTTTTKITGTKSTTVDTDDDPLFKILKEYKDFLLEPLEYRDAVLESDSIYTPQMTRQQRYETYRQSMDERINSSKNRQVRTVLIAMKDFVLQFE